MDDDDEIRARVERLVEWARSEGRDDIIEALEAGFLYGCTGGEVWGGLRGGLTRVVLGPAPDWAVAEAIAIQQLHGYPTGRG
jgi:hypothetical protein